MSGETLEIDADYGRLPFDIFISHTGTLGSQCQRRQSGTVGGTRLGMAEADAIGTLGMSFVSPCSKIAGGLTAPSQPYQHRAESETSPPEISEEIRRVLATHQTVHERNISLVSSAGWQTVWLRTCYDADLVSKYEELKWRSEVPGEGVSENKILDDPALYNFNDGSEDSWRQVIVRVPGITDFHGIIDMNGDGSDLQYKSGQNDEYMVAQAEEESKEVWRDLARAQLRIQAGLYLLDREAIESGVIKILWLDEHGNIAWDNRLDPCNCRLEGLTSSLLSSISLVELANYNGTRGALIEN
ncbi:uncharacterized protein CDV56_104769 [Aspergillus thermomutatus]|uniref:Uncharacterized protein n=1 Tax=Aspergillus thermomutatus TaxID=41047 RepID=A0A397HPS3_ASPTH|nr:uncharacterized protein CDV56_104769 [Aspergillus thermomutatus]RHZ63586.1 hypothetical protein CDV56_104769 [Aspergillus thermomutatus]